jgi:hypothetical protein
MMMIMMMESLDFESQYLYDVYTLSAALASAIATGVFGYRLEFNECRGPCVARPTGGSEPRGALRAV